MELCRRVSVCRMMEGGLGFEWVAVCRRWHRENRQGLDLIRFAMGWFALYPGPGCSGLNKPDSGLWGLQYVYTIIAMVVNGRAAGGSEPLAATSIGWVRK